MEHTFLKQNINPVRNTYNSFTVFMQTMNVNLVCKVKFIGKTLPLPKHEDIIINSMTRKKEKNKTSMF